MEIGAGTRWSYQKQQRPDSFRLSECWPCVVGNTFCSSSFARGFLFPAAPVWWRARILNCNWWALINLGPSLILGTGSMHGCHTRPISWVRVQSWRHRWTFHAFIVTRIILHHGSVARKHHKESGAGWLSPRNAESRSVITYWGGGKSVVWGRCIMQPLQ